MDTRHFPPSRRWAEEVLYLHSLWHQGPPQNPNPNPNLRPINCTQFKKPKTKRNKKRKNQSQAINPPPPAPEIEWPVNPSPDRNAEPAGWPDPAPNPHALPPPSAEERARASALWVQRAVLKSCREFLAGSDDDEAKDEVEDEEDAEAKAFEFFLGVFENDEELRGYYVKSNEKGEFLCLVCGGIGVKLGKRYGDCVGLVLHSSSIGKTKRRGAHRGFGRAVCRVLGWDVNRLPNIVLDRGEPLGQSLVKEGEMQGDLQKEDGVREIVEISNVILGENKLIFRMMCIKETSINKKGFLSLLLLISRYHVNCKRAEVTSLKRGLMKGEQVELRWATRMIQAKMTVPIARRKLQSVGIDAMELMMCRTR